MFVERPLWAECAGARGMLRSINAATANVRFIPKTAFLACFSETSFPALKKSRLVALIARVTPSEMIGRRGHGVARGRAKQMGTAVEKHTWKAGVVCQGTIADPITRFSYSKRPLVLCRLLPASKPAALVPITQTSTAIISVPLSAYVAAHESHRDVSIVIYSRVEDAGWNTGTLSGIANRANSIRHVCPEQTARQGVGTGVGR